MSRNITVDIEGLRELEANLKRLGKDGKVILNKSLFKGAGVAQKDAVKRTETMFGESELSTRRNRMFRGKLLRETKNARPLHQSIVRKRDRRSNPYEETIYVQTKNFYAHMIEFGHHWVVPDRSGKLHLLDKTYPPHPFMQPAYENNKTEIVDVVGKEAARLIVKSAKGGL